jgi:translocator protein
VGAKKAGLLVAALIISFIPGVVGSHFTTAVIPTWYASLIKPSFNPPNWVFGPVWTLLYLMMGVALSIVVWDGLGRRWVKTAVIAFIAQLFLNGLWSYVFFGLKSPGLAFLDIIALWASIMLTMAAFFRVSEMAGTLLVPYFAWVTFAAVLNGAIWHLNK